jgi:hypothetical protein
MSRNMLQRNDSGGHRPQGNNASKITPEQVQTIRQTIKTHPGPFTPDELQQIPVQ